MLSGHVWTRARVASIPLCVLLVALLVLTSPPHPAAAAVACTTPNPGEVTVYWFDVEQGDSQLIIGPSGKTLLVDLGETAWNSKGTNTKATLIEAKIRSICGTGSNPVALDYVMASHHHLDHIGYAWNPQDSPGAVGNGLYQLLTPTSLGGYGFTVGMLIDRDAGTWRDTNGDGKCTVGTSSSPSNEIEWHNAGTTSQTARRWICWLYGPAGQADRAIIQGKVFTLTNTNTWPALDLGTGVTATIINANGKDTMQADGVTPVSGDHTGASTPPSENDYSVAVRIKYGNWEYATAGDSDGEYSTSSFGYTYNDIEAKLGPLYGNVETYRLNHHGSGKSSNNAFLGTLKPETAVISCGSNSYGHPSNRVTDALRGLANEKGTGTDMYITNNPCDPYQSDDTTPTNYSGILNTNGDIRLVTTSGGSGYVIYYDVGSRTYATYVDDDTSPAAPTNLTATAGSAQVSLSWTGSSGASSYNVKRSTTSGGPYTTVATGVTTTSYTNTGLTNGTTYYFVVTAVNSAGESGNSNEASATPVAPDPSKVLINEFLMAPDPTSNGEWVELYNPTSQAIDLSGLYIDDVAGGGGSPKQIPAGTTIAAGGRWVFSFSSGFLNNTGSESVRYLKIVGGVETVYDSYSYSLGSTQHNKVFHRIGDGGAWCNTISTNVTKGTANPTTCP